MRDMAKKLIFRELLIILATIILSRYGSGAFVFVIVFWGVASALTNKVGRAFACYITLTLLILLNPFILPGKGMLFSIAVRGGSLLIGLCVSVIGITRRGGLKIPLSTLWIYLIIAAISSADGWYAQISYLKILQFSVFLASVIIGTQNIMRQEHDIFLLRSYIVAVTIFVVLGSAVIWPFPQWSSLGAVITFRNSLGDFGAVEEMVADGMYLNQALLCGVLYQSQALSSVTACLFVWLLSDSLFVEKRVGAFRGILLSISLLILYLTRSRTGLLALIVGIFLMAIYVMPRITLPDKRKVIIKHIFWSGFVLLAIIGCVAELKDHNLSRWIRKTDDVDSDLRTTTEAVTASRMGLIAKSMRDFSLNPMLGMGFQVEERHRDHIKGHSGSGLIISASIEKGVLPVMVLGETGIVGLIVFLYFILSFYRHCAMNKLYNTSLLFSTFLATNMGEATFFSPGGPGGLEWMVCAVGGFVLDLTMRCQAKQNYNEYQRMLI